MEKLKIEYVNIDSIKPYKNNAKLHPAEQIEQIKKSIDLFGMDDPIGIWKDEIVEGHGRLIACKELGMKEVPIIRLDHLTDEERKAYTLAHNKLTMNSDFDIDLLNDELEDITSIDMEDFGFDLDLDLPVLEKEEHNKLTDKFIVPPVSILDTRQGYWEERKKLWREMNIDNAEAREDAIVQTAQNAPYFEGEFNSTSLLDPVLSEIVVKWFMPKEGNKCFDVFAGDTIFGFVSSYCDKEFTGIELRKEQVDYNNSKVNKYKLNAKYICDDGRNVLQHIKENSQDLLFSCPPYFDLEVYSDKEEDASNQKNYQEFYKILDTAFANAIKCLKENRFAVVVVGDIRNKKTGEYYDFITDIKETFKNNGMCLYNELILINSYGTAGIRANNQMKSRKVVKVHQNVLVFYKGDTKNIKDEFQEIDFEEMENLYESEDE